MGRVAFVFSGQGDQHPGMGAAIAARYPAAKAVFDRCDAIRPGTSDQCFSGSDAELRETLNTQPCLYAMETAAAASLSVSGLKPDMVAGFSLGELAALACAGVLSEDDGFRLVCRRGELMQQAAEANPAAMAAVLRLTNEQVAEICSRHEDVYPVNYNCPGQVSVSGLESSMPAFLADVKQSGGRAMPLKVRGGFHSPFMNEAAREFAYVLDAVTLNAPRTPVYSDVTGDLYPDETAPTLAKQICAPVRWEEIVRNMIRDGADTFIEIGPGKTLCGLIGRIDKTVRTFSVSSYENLDDLIAEVKSC